jgi:hypothetical protein
MFAELSSRSVSCARTTGFLTAPATEWGRHADLFSCLWAGVLALCEVFDLQRA